MKHITSPHNEQLKHLAKLLTSSKARREHQQAVLEGAHLLDAYLNAQLVPQQVYIPEAKLHHPDTQTLLSRLHHVPISLVSTAALSKITSLTEGAEIISLIALPNESSVPIQGDCVVLERVQDPGNVGTILRSAAASGVKHIILGADCVDVWSPKVVRAAMGAHFLLQLFTRVDLWAWQAQYQAPLWATALSEHNNHSLYHLNLTQPCAWLFGNEGSGVSAALQQAATGTVKIPMLGATESLNVAMAATICLFEQMRQRLS